MLKLQGKDAYLLTGSLIAHKVRDQEQEFWNTLRAHGAEAWGYHEWARLANYLAGAAAAFLEKAASLGNRNASECVETLVLSLQEDAAAGRI